MFFFPACSKIRYQPQFIKIHSSCNIIIRNIVCIIWVNNDIVLVCCFLLCWCFKTRVSVRSMKAKNVVWDLINHKNYDMFPGVSRISWLCVFAGKWHQECILKLLFWWTYEVNFGNNKGSSQGDQLRVCSCIVIKIMILVLN